MKDSSMILPPQYNKLSTDCLSKVFNNTVAAYKYYWFLSILQLHAMNTNLRISVWDIVIRMVANAWYPVHYFRLSFGKSDSLYEIVVSLQENTQIPIDAGVETVFDGLRNRLDEPGIRSTLRKLTLNVPYRFLHPWIPTSDDKLMISRSQTYENDCLYALYKENEDFYILLNAEWDDYLHKHYQILTDFTYWNLTQFLQTRNPNVPAITNKLIRPETRNSLIQQHNLWDKIIDYMGPIRCIYTNKLLDVGDYDLDHFIPWSFVSHDLLWNLIPSDGSINSSKSNKLPDLEYYLPKMAELHQRSLKAILTIKSNSKLLEDFLSIGTTAEELAKLSKEDFLNVYQRTFTPLNQIALNMGFETWKY